MTIKINTLEAKNYVIYDGKGSVFNIVADTVEENFNGNNYSIIFYQEEKIVAKFHNFSAILVMPFNQPETMQQNTNNKLIN